MAAIHFETFHKEVSKVVDNLIVIFTEAARGGRSPAEP
jgi:hypothetical protein